MADLKNNSNINVLELLLKISNDVSAIKTDINNLKDSQAKERADIGKEILDVREDCMRELKSVESTIMARVQALQTVQNTLVGEVDVLKHTKEKKDAEKWKVITSFALTALGGMIVAKLPDIITFLLSTTIKGGN